VGVGGGEVHGEFMCAVCFSGREEGGVTVLSTCEKVSKRDSGGKEVYECVWAAVMC